MSDRIDVRRLLEFLLRAHETSDDGYVPVNLSQIGAFEALADEADRRYGAICDVGTELGIIMPERVSFFATEGVAAVKQLRADLADSKAEVEELRDPNSEAHEELLLAAIKRSAVTSKSVVDSLRARVAELEGALRGYVNGDACSCGDVKYGAHECSYCSGRAVLTPQAQPPAEVRTNPDPLLPGLAVAIRIVAARLRTSRALRYSEVFTAALDEVLVFLRAEEERAIHPETASLTTTCTAQPAQGVAGNGDGREHMLTCASQRNFGKRGPCDCIEPDPDTLPTISRRQVEEAIADACGVSLPTVRRWFAGLSMPHKAMLPFAFKKVMRELGALGLTPPAKEET